MHSFLSCALDLLLLHDQVPEGGDDALIRVDGVVELEVLRAEDSRVYLFDTADEELVSLARHIVASAALAWHRDTSFPATPGQQCTWCAVREWCPSRDAGADGHDATREVDDVMATRTAEPF
jgi:hypothetical protein